MYHNDMLWLDAARSHSPQLLWAAPLLRPLDNSATSWSSQNSFAA